MQLVAEVLGPVRLSLDGESVDVGGARQRRLVGVLLAESGSVVSTDRLIDAVFEGDVTTASRGTFRTYVARIRRALTAAGLDAMSVVVTESSGYVIPSEAVDRDWVEFEDAVREAQDRLTLSEPDEAVSCLEPALGRWRGPAYGEFAAEDWAMPEAVRLEELRLSARELHVQALIDSGRHGMAAAEVEALIAEEPLREGPRRQLMLALYRAGRHAEALRVGRGFRQDLAEETGLEPSAQLVELEELIIGRDPRLELTPTGQALRGYRLGEQLGEGAFAVVYRGVQPSVGRDVAVKIIRPELANRPEFVRRFEVEAHLVARLEHPHIVPLYDYWREPGRACLAFRYLRGGTLESHLTSNGALDLTSAARLAEQVGSALIAAHEAGVVHRDVKPANVFLDLADNFYLGDFGIALDAAELQDPSAALSEGSPAYASPEQLRRQAVGPTADVHGLGVALFESLTGSLPFPEATTRAELLRRQLHDPIPSVTSLRDDVTPSVDEVLSRATEKSAVDRYQSIEELVTDFVVALDRPDEVVRSRGSSTVVSRAVARNPYKGLRAFTEADAADFFGRERLVDRLVNLLRRTDTAGRIVAVVGPSGIGKSSVVRAGLLPALRRGAVDGSEGWFVATMLPGKDPFEELGSALLRVATKSPENLMSQLTEDHRGVARVIKALIPTDSSTELLLIIDQFEELFTLVDDEITQRHFLDALRYAVTDVRCPLRVVFTVRADFWDRPLRHGSFAKLIDDSTVAVTALAPDEVELAVTAPARREGCELEPGLVAEIVADVTDQPGALPLLQYALTELYENRISGVLTREAYAELGGVSGALARRAEEIYADATPQEQEATRRVFGRLVTVGEGNTEDTRRQALQSEVATIEAADAVVERFGEARLLSFDREQATRRPTVEVAHEALIHRWPRLREWLDEDREHLRHLRHLAGAAADWDEAGRPEGELYRGVRLEAAAALIRQQRGELTTVERSFVEASVERHRADQEADARSNRRLRRLLATVGTVAVLAVIAGLVAFQQWARAEGSAEDARGQAVRADANAALTADERDRADAERSRADAAAGDADLAREAADIRRMVAEAVNVAASDRQLGLLIAREAYERDPSPVTLGALQSVMLSAPRNWIASVSGDEQYTSIAFLPDGSLIALGGSMLDRWDVERVERIETVSLPSTATAIGLSSDGERVGIGYESGRWETRRTTDWTVASDGTVDGQVWFVALGERSETIGLAVRDVASAQTSVYINHPDGDLDAPLGPYGEVTDLAFGPNDELVLVAKGSLFDAEVFDVATGQAIGPPLVLGDSRVTGAEAGAWFGNDVVIANFESVATFDPRSGAVVDGPYATASRFGSSGDIVVTAEGIVLRGDDGDVQLYRPGQGLESLVSDDQMPGLAGKGLAASPDVGFVAMLEVSGPTHLYSTTGKGTLAVGQLPVDPLAVEINESASILMTWPPATVWSADDFSTPVETVEPYAKLFEGNDSFFLLSPTINDGQNALWRDGVLHTHNSERFIHPNSYVELPDGSAGVVDGRLNNEIAGVRVIDPLTGAPITELTAVGEELRLATESRFEYAPDLQFTPDASELVVTTRPGRVFFYDTTNWTESRQPLSIERSFHGIDFASDGSWAFVYNRLDGTVSIVDAENFETLQGPVPVPQFVGRGGQNPDILAGDRYAIIGGAPGGAMLWDLEQLSVVGDSFPHETDGRQPAVASEAHVLATAHDQQVVLWSIEPDTWPEVACRAAGRNMTREEWDKFGPTDEPFRTTCNR